MTIWGHDVLADMGLLITNNYSEAARGLGKGLQGRVEPIQTKDNPNRQMAPKHEMGHI